LAVLGWGPGHDGPQDGAHPHLRHGVVLQVNPGERGGGLAALCKGEGEHLETATQPLSTARATRAGVRRGCLLGGGGRGHEPMERRDGAYRAVRSQAQYTRRHAMNWQWLEGIPKSVRCSPGDRRGGGGLATAA